ncbi:MAG: type II toxin-antitoxin system VapC family toxin [Phycisphaeraceae bacterium]|nr:type II toxin-antitoxin system VapC family toxin [Phycisphaeraceae bacterium]MBX3407548.1 type II toxin-antitoxin system VapC family toxin [Phycisphaeraceae bacterium]
MAMKWVIDTNIVLYHLGGRLDEPIPAGEHSVSVITELELLSWDQLDQPGDAAVRAFLGAVGRVDLTQAVKDAAVVLRRTARLKLPDATVAASALATGATLLTADERLHRVPGLAAAPLKLKR